MIILFYNARIQTKNKLLKHYFMMKLYLVSIRGFVFRFWCKIIEKEMAIMQKI
jgi:hypothetical protein